MGKASSSSSNSSAPILPRPRLIRPEIIAADHDKFSLSCHTGLHASLRCPGNDKHMCQLAETDEDPKAVGRGPVEDVVPIPSCTMGSVVAYPLGPMEEFLQITLMLIRLKSSLFRCAASRGSHRGICGVVIWINGSRVLTDLEDRLVFPSGCYSSMMIYSR